MRIGWRWLLLVVLGAATMGSALARARARGALSGDEATAYRVIKAALSQLAEDGSITLTSGVASRGTMPNHSTISAVNAAIEAAARQLAKEQAPRRINVVAPGVTATTTYDAMPPEAKAQFVARMTSVIPLKRIATAEEIALSYIFSMQCTYLTGTVLDASGGQLVA